MRAPLLLDTCACIFINEDRLTRASEQILADRYAAGENFFVSPWTAWELASLLRLGRLRSSLAADDYFHALMRRPRFVLAGMPTEVLMASWFLPGDPPRDAADRIIAATGRIYGYTVMTRDQPLLDYAAEGHLSAVNC